MSDRGPGAAVNTPAELPCLMLPEREVAWLLPGAAVVEVLARQPLRAKRAGAPGWCAGTLAWRGRQLPVIAPGALTVSADALSPKVGREAYLVILNRVTHATPLGFYALVACGMPRFLTVSADDLTGGHQAPGPGERMRVHLDGETAAIPDLPALETLLVQHGLAGAH